MDKQKSLDQWRQFFAAMADGLLPYLQLYVKCNQRGSGVGNFVSSRYRYQVPLLMNNSSQIGSGSLQSARVHMVNPTQQTVEQAKSIVKKGNDSNSLMDLIEKAPVKENVLLGSLRTEPNVEGVRPNSRNLVNRIRKLSKSEKNRTHIETYLIKNRRWKVLAKM